MGVLLVVVKRILMAMVIRLLLYLLRLMTRNGNMLEVFNHVLQIFYLRCFYFSSSFNASLLTRRQRMKLLRAFMDVPYVVVH